MKPIILRFLARIKIDPDSGCWIWQGKPHSDNYGCGYGRFYIGRIKYYAHRVAYVLFIGPIPFGLVVRHNNTCTSMCVNPCHLRTGTVEENNKDKIGTRYYKHKKPEAMSEESLGDPF